MKLKIGCLVVIFAMFLSSCKVFNPTRMLRTGIDYKYDNIDSIPSEIYKINVNDQIAFTISTNHGEALINPMSTSVQIDQNQIMRNQQGNGIDEGYFVDFDGTVNLPIIGRSYLQGMTIREAELFLENKYSAYFNTPYVKMKITNKRVFVFKGSTALVSNLTSQNTTLYELLSQIGGVGDAKAHKIKLIRNKSDKTYVYAIDLSKIQNIKQGNIVLQSNDIVYITPRDKVAMEISNAITPYLSLFATAFAIIAIFK